MRCTFEKVQWSWISFSPQAKKLRAILSTASLYFRTKNARWIAFAIHNNSTSTTTKSSRQILSNYHRAADYFFACSINNVSNNGVVLLLPSNGFLQEVSRSVIWPFLQKFCEGLGGLKLRNSAVLFLAVCWKLVLGLGIWKKGNWPFFTTTRMKNLLHCHLNMGQIKRISFSDKIRNQSWPATLSASVFMISGLLLLLPPPSVFFLDTVVGFVGLLTSLPFEGLPSPLPQDSISPTPDRSIEEIRGLR